MRERRGNPRREPIRHGHSLGRALGRLPVEDHDVAPAPRLSAGLIGELDVAAARRAARVMPDTPAIIEVEQAGAFPTHVRIPSVPPWPDSCLAAFGYR